MGKINGSKKPRRRTLDAMQPDFLALLEGAIDMPAAVPEPRREAGAVDMEMRVRTLLNEAIKAGPFADRAHLAEAVSYLSGRRITKPMIDSWTGASRPHHFPADLVPAFCVALGNSILLHGLAEAAGCGVTESIELMRSRLERLALFIRFAKAEQKRIEASMPLFQGARS